MNNVFLFGDKPIKYWICAVNHLKRMSTISTHYQVLVSFLVRIPMKCTALERLAGPPNLCHEGRISVYETRMT